MANTSDAGRGTEAPQGNDQKTQGGMKPSTATGRSGGEANPPAGGAADNARNTPSSQAGSMQSMGSRGGSAVGSQAERTGMSDGGLAPGASSQGLTGAQGSGGGADGDRRADDAERGRAQSEERGVLPDAQDRED